MSVCVCSWVLGIGIHIILVGGSEKSQTQLFREEFGSFADASMQFYMTPVGVHFRPWERSFLALSYPPEKCVRGSTQRCSGGGSVVVVVAVVVVVVVA